MTSEPACRRGERVSWVERASHESRRSPTTPAVSSTDFFFILAIFRKKTRLDPKKF
jgi:hypothetical protein